MACTGASTAQLSTTHVAMTVLLQQCYIDCKNTESVLPLQHTKHIALHCCRCLSWSTAIRIVPVLLPTACTIAWHLHNVHRCHRPPIPVYVPCSTSRSICSRASVEFSCSSCRGITTQTDEHHAAATRKARATSCRASIATLVDEDCQTAPSAFNKQARTASNDRQGEHRVRFILDVPQSL